jgi:hypothetical protein
VKRDEAIAVLKQIAESKRFGFSWISLVNVGAGWEIRIKPEQGNDLTVLRAIFENHGLQLKEVKGTLVIYREH